MTLEDAEAAVLKFLATTPGARDAFHSEIQREMAGLLYRQAELRGFQRGFAAGNETAAASAEILQRVREVVG